MNKQVHNSLKDYQNTIENHIQIALSLAKDMQQVTLLAEGDSDLNRKLAYYLIPALTHWVEGAQAGNMKDLKELFERREKDQVVKEEQEGKIGDGHEILTEPKNRNRSKQHNK